LTAFQITFATRPCPIKAASPTSPEPVLLLITVRPRAPWSIRAWISSIGAPDPPKPPIITVAPSGDLPPVANPDLAETDEDTFVDIPVLANDSDPNGDPLVVTGGSAPNGTVTVNPDGTIRYTPNPDYNGLDTITYTIEDPAGNTADTGSPGPQRLHVLSQIHLLHPHLFLGEQGQIEF
jgi:hypothetical protein